MACDEKLTERFREILERPRGTTRRRTFGGRLVGKAAHAVQLIGMATS